MSPTILVIGDFILDETYHVEVNRISPEAPVATAELLHRRPTQTPGGAGFAAAFAARQGYNVYLAGAIAPRNRNLLSQEYNIKVIGVEEVELNVTKTRFVDLASGYHILRLDNDKIAGRPTSTPEKVISGIEPIVGKIDACLISDYRKGFFDPTFSPWSRLISYFTLQQIPIILDTRNENIRHWFDDNEGKEPLGRFPTGAWLKLNRREIRKVTDNLLSSKADPRELVDQGIISNLALTKSKEGAAIYQFTGKGLPSTRFYLPTPEKIITGAPDPTGCGDIFDISFIANLAESKDSKVSLQRAIETSWKFAYIPFKEKLGCLR